ncbi:MAG: response regulator [Treponema sp.]|nr:response regulator [Treponema sp.]MCL2237455.1 response regulator [Treponema sp.]
MSDKKIVLAIDDNLQQLSEFKSILIPEYDLRTVKSASEAVAFLIKNKANVILLDIEMPNINGFEFLNDLIKIPSYLSTPIIIVSGNTGQDFLTKAKSTDVFDIMIKPVNRDNLIAVIEKALASKD